MGDRKSAGIYRHPAGKGKSGTYKQKGYMRRGINRTKNHLIFGFTFATETTGVIEARDKAIDLEDGVHAHEYLCKPEVTERGRNHSSGSSGGIRCVDVGGSSSSSGSGSVGGNWI